MSLTRFTVLYGKLEGAAGKFSRDPSGYLSIEAGIFREKGLEVSWEHVQGTEERYRRLDATHTYPVRSSARLEALLDEVRQRVSPMVPRPAR